MESEEPYLGYQGIPNHGAALDLAVIPSMRAGSVSISGYASTLNAGIGRFAQPATSWVGNTLVKPNVQAGLLSGGTNALFDYSINRDIGSATTAFGTGFAGGVAGNLAGGYVNVGSRAVTSGLVGGGVSELMAQTFNSEQQGYDAGRIIMASALGGSATFGVNRALGIYAPRGLIVTPDSASFRPLASNVIAGYGVSYVLDNFIYR